jgi:putative alpha-1,2-mannosidase
MPDISQSIVLMAQLGGSLPQWPFVDIYTCAMVGQHAQNLLADAFLWGIRGFNMSAAFSVAVKAATTQEAHCARRHADEYNQQGYISVESDARGVCCEFFF